MNVLEHAEKALLERLQELLIPASGTGNVLKSLQSGVLGRGGEDLAVQVASYAGQSPLGVLSLGGNVSMRRETKPAGPLQRVDMDLAYTFAVIIPSLARVEKKKVPLYEVFDRVVAGLEDWTPADSAMPEGWRFFPVSISETAVLSDSSSYTALAFFFSMRALRKVC